MPEHADDLGLDLLRRIGDRPGSAQTGLSDTEGRMTAGIDTEDPGVDGPAGVVAGPGRGVQDTDTRVDTLETRIGG